MLLLNDSEIHLWHARQSDFEGASLEAACLHWLTPGELKRFQRFHFESHRQQLLLGRALIRVVLSQYCDTAPDAWQFIENPYGKPAIAPEQQGQPLFFNLSHSMDQLVLAVSRQEAIGIDIECVEKTRRVAQIAERYFAPSEVKDLMRLPQTEHLRRFYQLWTLKESYIKACGLGLAIPLRHFSYAFPGEDRISIKFASDRGDDPVRWQFWQFDIDAPFQQALAIKSGEVRVKQLLSRKLTSLESFEEIETKVSRY